MVANVECAVCLSGGVDQRATHRVVLETVTLNLCREHAERYADHSDLRRWEAA